jgi:hypothetical protein
MSNNPMPYMPATGTAGILANQFDTGVYNTDPSSLIYKFVDALCGSTGAGSLLNQTFLNTLQGNLSTTYGSDLDYFFGNIGFLPRTPSEMYLYNAATDLLTSDQWREVQIKDAFYRARVRDFWKACGLGGTPEGIRMTVLAACACDCNVFEDWRYIDDYGLTEPVGRADARNEVVVQPLKSSLTPQEMKLLRDMLARIMPLDTIVTINPQGLAVLTPVPVKSAASNSTYFQINKQVLATPILSQLPPPEALPIDLLPTETWLYDAQTDPQIAPYAALNISAQVGFYYLIGGGNASPIDSVQYLTLNEDGSTSPAANYVAYSSTSQYTPWTNYAKADSPDNYPGGKYGIHPSYAPALNSDGTPYNFPWDSQTDFVAAQRDRPWRQRQHPAVPAPHPGPQPNPARLPGRVCGGLFGPRSGLHGLGQPDPQPARADLRESRLDFDYWFYSGVTSGMHSDEVHEP